MLEEELARLDLLKFGLSQAKCLGTNLQEVTALGLADRVIRSK